MEKATDALDNIRARTTFSEPVIIGDIMRKPSQVARHIATGLRGIDAYTSGPALGELWIIGAWPGHGKSALQTHIALEAATATEPLPVLFWSLEMPEMALKNRMLANVSGVPVSRILRDDLNSGEVAAISEKGQRLINAPIYIQDGSASIDAIVGVTRRMVERKGIKVVMVDYVQIVDAPGATFREQLTTVAHKLLHLAVDNNITVVAASQLRKPSDGRSAEPNEHDLRESGALNDDPHVVVLVHRPDKGHWDNDTNMTKDTTAIVNIAKNRNGQTGCATVAWNGPCLRFNDIASDTAEPEQRTVDFPNDDIPF